MLPPASPAKLGDGFTILLPAWLAELGADLNTPDRDGATPVLVAARGGHVEAIRVLTAGGSGKGGGKEKRVREEGLPEAASTLARAL